MKEKRAILNRLAALSRKSKIKTDLEFHFITLSIEPLVKFRRKFVSLLKKKEKKRLTTFYYIVAR